VAAARGANAFGTCGDCRHFSAREGGGHCACVAAELTPDEIGQLCASFAAGEEQLLRLPEDQKDIP
jgi:hypothetical protein